MSSTMDRSDVMVVTATRYPNYGSAGAIDDNTRGSLALETALAAQRIGCPFTVVDSDSSEMFLLELKNAGVTPIKQQQPGMSSGRQQGFRHAFENPHIQYVLWIEPEKHYFLRDCFQIVLGAIDESTWLVIPNRMEEGLKTLPPLQMQSESAANNLYNQMLRDFGFARYDSPTLDVFGGPRLFHRKLLPLFLQSHRQVETGRTERKLAPHAYSNALFFPIPYALHEGYTVKSVDVPLRYPHEQTRLETGNEEYIVKRLSQLDIILEEHIQLLRLLRGIPSALELYTPE